MTWEQVGPVPRELLLSSEQSFSLPHMGTLSLAPITPPGTQSQKPEGQWASAGPVPGRQQTSPFLLEQSKVCRAGTGLAAPIQS